MNAYVNQLNIKMGEKSIWAQESERQATVLACPLGTQRGRVQRKVGWRLPAHWAVGWRLPALPPSPMRQIICN